MTTGNEDLDLQALWDETDDDGNVIKHDTDEQDDPQFADDSDQTDVEDESTDEEDGDDASDDDSSGESDSDEIDYKALWQKSQNEVKTMTGRLKAETERLAREKQELAGRVPPEPAEPSDDDKFLAKFKDDYSEDVLKAIDLISTRKASQIVEQTIAQRLSPVEQQTYNMIEQAHFGAIESVHPDVYDIDQSPQFEAWLETRPAHTKGAYLYIRENGTPQEVISMLNEYKDTLHKTSRTAEPSKSKVESATAVQRRRGTVSTTAEPTETDLAALWNSIPD